MRVRPKTRIKMAIQQAQKEIREISCTGGKYAGGLASEGYSGGYFDALCDVMLLLNGVVPQRRQYWDAEAMQGKGNRR